MNLTPRFVVTSLAELVIVVLFAIDVVADPDWSSGLRVVGRVLAVVAAVAVAAIAFQVWSAAGSRTLLLHAAAAAGLLGGASVFAAVTGADDRSVFGNAALAALGTAGTVVAVLALRLEAARADGAAGTAD